VFSGVSDIFFFVGLFGEFVFSDSIFCEMKSEKMGCFGFGFCVVKENLRSWDFVLCSVWN